MCPKLLKEGSGLSGQLRVQKSFRTLTMPHLHTIAFDCSAMHKSFLVLLWIAR